jgi:hypothetical protein
LVNSISEQIKSIVARKKIFYFRIKVFQISIFSCTYQPKELMKNIVILLVLTSICFANEPLKPTPVSVPPIIDGQLDEWKNIFAVETFKTFFS